MCWACFMDLLTHIPLFKCSTSDLDGVVEKLCGFDDSHTLLDSINPERSAICFHAVLGRATTHSVQ